MKTGRIGEHARFGTAILVVVTVIAGLSFGFQIFVVWLLVPLHWFAAKDARAAATACWAMLSMILIGPAALLFMYFVGAAGWPATSVSAVALAATAFAYADRWRCQNAVNRVARARGPIL